MPAAVVSSTPAAVGTWSRRAPSLVHDRLGQNMGGEGLGRGGEPEQFVVAGAGHRLDDVDHGVAVRDGSGLVQGDGADAGQGLHHPTRLHDHPVGGRPAHAREEGHRGGDQQRARRGHHQHLGEADGVARTGTSEAGDAQRDQGERHGVAVGEPDDRRLARRGGLHEVDDLLVLAVSGRDAGPHQGDALLADRARKHLIARAVLDRQWLAGDRRLVEGGRLALEQAVHRDHLTGTRPSPGHRPRPRRSGPPRTGRRCVRAVGEPRARSSRAETSRCARALA